MINACAALHTKPDQDTAAPAPRNGHSQSQDGSGGPEAGEGQH